ncbi:MAG: hypothetical protein ACLT98_07155 [Eggerthellaceae bacterium]
MTRLAHGHFVLQRPHDAQGHGKVRDEKEGNELQRIDERMLKGMHHYFHISNHPS